MRSLLAFAVLLPLISCGSKIPEGAVMMVGERVLFPEDVTLSMQRAGGDSSTVMVMRDNILARELFLQHAHDMGLDSIPNNVRRMYERRREVLQNAYLDHLLSGLTIVPEELAAFRDSLSIMVVYSAFYTADPAVLDTFMTRLGAGDDFNALVSEYAADAYIRETGGRLGPVSLARTNREDYAILRNLAPGQVGEPVVFRPGWRVLKLNELRNAAPDSAQLDEHELEMAFLALRRESIRISAQDSLCAAVGLEIHLDACSLIASRAGSPDGDYEPFTETEQEMTAISWNGGSRTLVSLANNITDLPPTIPRNVTDPVWVSEYAYWLGLYDAQAMVAAELGLDTLPEVAAQIERRQGETLLDQYYLTVLENRMILDEALLEQHYIAARDSITIPEKRVYVHVAAQGPEQVALLNSLFADGENPVSHSDRLTLIPQLSESQGSARTHPMDAAEFPEAFRERVMALEPGEAMVCSLETDFHVYFRLEEILPPHQPSLDEIRSILEPRVMAEVEVRVIEGLVDSLKEVYHPYIDEEFFRTFIAPADTTAATPSSDERREGDL